MPDITIKTIKLKEPKKEKPQPEPAEPIPAGIIGEPMTDITATSSQPPPAPEPIIPPPPPPPPVTAKADGPKFFKQIIQVTAGQSKGVIAVCHKERMGEQKVLMLDCHVPRPGGMKPEFFSVAAQFCQVLGTPLIWFVPAFQEKPAANPLDSMNAPEQV